MVTRAIIAADVRVGDVWKGKGSTGQLVKVVHIARNPWECDKVEWQGVGRRTSGRCDLVPFPQRRTLHERGGLRIGDVRAMGKASTTKVLVLRDDVAVCDDADGIRTYPAAEIAALPLVSRKEP
jgi:hypothetical protein